MLLLDIFKKVINYNQKGSPIQKHLQLDHF